MHECARVQVRVTPAAPCTMVRGMVGRLLLLCAAVAVLAPPAPARAAPSNPHGLAVIIGNRTYTHGDVPPVDYAHRDAQAFKRYVIDVLGTTPTTSFISKTPPAGG